MATSKAVYMTHFEDGTPIAPVQFEKVRKTLLEFYAAFSGEDRDSLTARLDAAMSKGPDVGLVLDRYMFWLLAEVDSPLGENRSELEVVTVADLYRQKLEGKEVSAEVWAKAAKAAWAVVNELYGHRWSSVSSAASVAARSAGKNVLYRKHPEFCIEDQPDKVVEAAFYVGSTEPETDHLTHEEVDELEDKRMAIIAKRMAERFVCEVEANARAIQ